MIDPKTCNTYDTYYGFVGGLERKLVRDNPWLDEPWSYEDKDGTQRSASDRNVSHLIRRPRFLIEPEAEEESTLDQENQRLHNEWMIEHIRASAAEEQVRQLEDFILGANFSSLPEPPSEITEGNVYIWSGKHNVYTAPGKSVLLPADLPHLKAEEAIELGKFLYAAGQVSKGTK